MKDQEQGPALPLHAVPGLILLILVLCGVCIPLVSDHGPVVYLLLLPAFAAAGAATEALGKLRARRHRSTPESHEAAEQSG